jgi:hypothetical protein
MTVASTSISPEQMKGMHISEIIGEDVFADDFLNYRFGDVEFFWMKRYGLAGSGAVVGATVDLCELPIVVVASGRRSSRSPRGSTSRWPTRSRSSSAVRS